MVGCVVARIGTRIVAGAAIGIASVPCVELATGKRTASGAATASTTAPCCAEAICRTRVGSRMNGGAIVADIIAPARPLTVTVAVIGSGSGVVTLIVAEALATVVPWPSKNAEAFAPETPWRDAVAVATIGAVETFDTVALAVAGAVPAFAIVADSARPLPSDAATVAE